MKLGIAGILTLTLAAFATSAVHADIYGLEEGQAELKAAGPLAFGPDGILFVGDPQGASIFALQTGDKQGNPAQASFEMKNVAQHIAKAVGADAEAVSIADMAVNPQSGNVFFAVNVQEGSPQILKLDPSGKLTPLNLEKIAFSKAALPNAAEDKEVGEGRRRRNNRGSSVTDLAFVNGEVIVSGLSNQESASNVWSLLFPFQEVDQGTSLQIYHGAHGREEDYSPIRTFVPMVIDGEPNLLAGFVCTPLVKFPLSQVAAEAKIEGTTVAELGNHNQPLDMISYQKDGKTYLLLTNSDRGVMKISTEGIERQEGITSHIADGGTAGQDYETVDSLTGVVQMDRLNDEHAVVLIAAGPDGGVNLETVPLP